jgi:AraC family transcriptional regulator, transcriptional activator of pobA
MNHIPTFNFRNIGRKEKLVDVLPWDYSNFYQTEKVHCHDYHELFVITSGSGVHQIDGIEHAIQSNSFHIVPNFFSHKFQRDPGTKGFTIAIQSIFIEQLCNFDKVSNYRALFDKEHIINLGATHFNSFNFFVNEIQNESINDAYLQNICAAILLKLITFINPETVIENTFSSLVRKTLELNYKKRLSNEQYADMFNLTAISFNLKVKKATGKTMIQMQNELLISNIKRLLFNTDANLKEIAFNFGFSDYAHFSNFFKKHTGNSPMGFKKDIQNIQ